ncbi:MAG: YicC/YloC family endoribonuclease [Bacteroidota bacterium]
MIRSMTGFGKAEKTTPRGTLSAELRCLNSKQFDLSMRLSASLTSWEFPIRNWLQTRLERGKCQLTLHWDPQEASELRLNTAFIESLQKQWAQYCVQSGKPIHTEIPAGLWNASLLLKSTSEEGEQLEEHLWMEVLEEAANALNEFRLREGQATAADLEQCCLLIEEGLTLIDRLDPERIVAYRERLSSLLERISLPSEEGRIRLEQELLLYVDKLDISEEKQRLAEHCRFFRQSLREENSGRTLGFIAQEMGREINTIGSKANHSGIQRSVVEMKNQLERIREQVLNLM